MTDDLGCCGHPAQCAFTAAADRCKSCENYENKLEPRKEREIAPERPSYRSSLEAFFASRHTSEERAAAKAEARADARRERAYDRIRGNDTGRMMTP